MNTHVLFKERNVKRKITKHERSTTNFKSEWKLWFLWKAFPHNRKLLIFYPFSAPHYPPSVICQLLHNIPYFLALIASFLFKPSLPKEKRNSRINSSQGQIFCEVFCCLTLSYRPVTGSQAITDILKQKLYSQINGIYRSSTVHLHDLWIWILQL